MRRFLNRLNPSWPIPSRQTLAGTLLEDGFGRLQEQVNSVIREMHLINVIIDESKNISHARIGNISIHHKEYALHYLSEDLGARRMTAVGATHWLLSHLQT
jgi:hypothetical protein